MENVTQIKSKNFAYRIVKLEKYLREEKKEFVLSKQILRAGTSIGANVTEAERSVSKKEFLSKMYIAYKECAETAYWLDLLRAGEYISKQEYSSLFADCDELDKLLASITKTIRQDTE